MEVETLFPTIPLQIIFLDPWLILSLTRAYELSASLGKDTPFCLKSFPVIKLKWMEEDRNCSQPLLSFEVCC